MCCPRQGFGNRCIGTDTPGEGSIFTDIQVVIKRTPSEEPGPGQMCAIQARKHIAKLRRAQPDIAIEIRWCPACKGDETADKWAKLAANKSDYRGVEWKQCTDRYGRRPMPLSRSLARLRREISGEGWREAE